VGHIFMIFFSLVLLPFLNFLNLALYSCKVGRQGSILFSGFLYFITFFFSLLNLVLYLSHLSFSTVILNLGIWFTSESLNVL
jgi:hypothetical protein